MISVDECVCQNGSVSYEDYCIEFIDREEGRQLNLECLTTIASNIKNHILWQEAFSRGQRYIFRVNVSKI